MQTIPLNMMAYRHEGIVVADEGKRRKKQPLDRFGYVGFTRVSDFADPTYGTGDRYPRADTDLQDFVRLPTLEDSVLFGVSSVTGQLPGRNCETFTVGGTVNIINTGTLPLNQWDTVLVIVAKPNSTDTGDFAGSLGVSSSVAPSVSREHLTGFTHPLGKPIPTIAGSNGMYKLLLWR
jgi:hypothetical protein